MSPLQIYHSALVFMLKKSIFYRQFLDQFSQWISHLPEVQDWSSSLQALEGHSDLVRTVVFSLNSQLLTSTSDYNIVRLWDAMTGASHRALKSVRNISSKALPLPRLHAY